MSLFPEYTHYDALGLAELVRTGQVHPCELVESAIERIEAVNPQVNAVIHKMYDKALAAAEQPLAAGSFAGVPFLLKDLTSDLAGEPMRKGSRFYQAVNYVPEHDAEMVRRFKATGLIILGKTNTPEMGLTSVTEPALFGPTRNPYDLTRTAGGSSGGSAAAVATRMVPLASGGDGMGSLRIPASCCGLFGFKPSRGRNPTGPIDGAIFQGFQAEHVLTRSVRDSAAMLDATSGPDAGAPFVAPPHPPSFLAEVSAPPRKLRIAFTHTPLMGHYVKDDCVTGLKATVALLQELGHEVIESTPPVDGKAVSRAIARILTGEFAGLLRVIDMQFQRKPKTEDFETATWVLMLLGQQYNAGDFVMAQWELAYAVRKVGQWFEENAIDVLLTPTLAEPPPLIGSQDVPRGLKIVLDVLVRLNAGHLIKAFGNVDAQAENLFAFTPYTPMFNVTGQPAMSVPLHWNDAGLPIGMQFVGRYADEATLFNLAGQLEQARPWANRKVLSL